MGYRKQPNPPPETEKKPAAPPGPPALRRPRDETEKPWGTVELAQKNHSEIEAALAKSEERRHRLDCLGLAVRLMQHREPFQATSSDVTDTAADFLEWLETDTEGEE